MLMILEFREVLNLAKTVLDFSQILAKTVLDFSQISIVFTIGQKKFEFRFLCQG